MSTYLFIQSQDPFTEARSILQYELARQLADSGSKVTLMLVQNGVTVAREGVQCESFDTLPAHGVTLMADSFALRQREINGMQLKSSVRAANIGLVIDAMLDGSKVIWN